MDITVEKAKDRMKELDSDIRQLTDEKRKYREYVINKENKNLYDIRKTYEGKYFIQKTQPIKFDYDSIKAFKVIKVTEKDKYYAECLVIVENNKTLENTVGIKKTCLGLWCKNTNDIIYNKSTSNIIDCYEEISKEEFVELYKKQRSILDKCI